MSRAGDTISGPVAQPAERPFRNREGGGAKPLGSTDGPRRRSSTAERRFRTAQTGVRLLSPAPSTVSATIAQRKGHLASNQGVAGSNPAGGTNFVVHTGPVWRVWKRIPLVSGGQVGSTPTIGPIRSFTLRIVPPDENGPDGLGYRSTTMQEHANPAPRSNFVRSPRVEITGQGRTSWVIGS